MLKYLSIILKLYGIDDMKGLKFLKCIRIINGHTDDAIAVLIRKSNYNLAIFRTPPWQKSFNCAILKRMRHGEERFKDY